MWIGIYQLLLWYSFLFLWTWLVVRAERRLTDGRDKAVQMCRKGKKCLELGYYFHKAALWKSFFKRNPMGTHYQGVPLIKNSIAIINVQEPLHEGFWPLMHSGGITRFVQLLLILRGEPYP